MSTVTRVLSLHQSYPGTEFIIVSLSLQFAHEDFLSCHCSAIANSEDSTQCNSFAPKLISWQAGVSKLTNSSRLNSSLYLLCADHADHAENSLSIAGKACLRRRCMVTEVMRLLLAYSLPRECLPSRCLAMNNYSDFAILAFGLHVTISKKLYFYNNLFSCKSSWRR
jgi:hypothetical protein